MPRPPLPLSFHGFSLHGRLRRLWAVLYRHAALYRRSWPRLLDFVYTPLLELAVWGWTMRFLAAHAGLAAQAAALSIAALLLWQGALSGQLGFSVSFLEDVWTRHLGHLFISPLRPAELLLALVLLALLRVAVGFTAAACLARALFALDVFRLGPFAFAFLALLAVMGLAIALGITALILRFGLGAERLVWTVMAALTPLSCVFYPAASLPPALRALALLLPSTHVFEGLRGLFLHQGSAPAAAFGRALLLDLLLLVLMASAFLLAFESARKRGGLLRFEE
jgi:ABC-2 type transport system permease protein